MGNTIDPNINVHQTERGTPYAGQSWLVEERDACGAGLMTAIPWELLDAWFAEQGIVPPARENCGVGMLFLSQDKFQATIARQVVEEVLMQRGLKLWGWRKVPIVPSVLGPQALEHQPQIEQV